MIYKREFSLKTDDIFLKFSDSGGPLQCDDKLVGIVSYGTRVCAVSYPDVYTRASEFVGNIKNIINKQFSG